MLIGHQNDKVEGPVDCHLYNIDVLIDPHPNYTTLKLLPPPNLKHWSFYCPQTLQLLTTVLTTLKLLPTTKFTMLTVLMPIDLTHGNFYWPQKNKHCSFHWTPTLRIWSSAPVSVWAEMCQPTSWTYPSYSGPPSPSQGSLSTNLSPGRRDGRPSASPGTARARNSPTGRRQTYSKTQVIQCI